MGDLFVYILKSSICLAVFYLFFKLMLCRETFHKFNRIVLLSLFLLSFTIPFIEITLQKETAYTGLSLNLDAIMAMSQSQILDGAAENASTQDIWLIAILVGYFLGLVISVAYAAWSFIRMFLLIRSKSARKIILSDKIVLIIHNKDIAPFSWIKFIVISENDYNDSGKDIITHEIAHISRYHSVDLLIAEAVKIIHWFNPAVYLMKQELQNIHEFQADETVINNGIDAKQYQLLLIKKAVGPRLYTIANSFNHSKLKTRITMISKKKSTKMAALKALFVLPLSAFAIVAFASEEVTSKMEAISNTKITEIFPQDTIKKAANAIKVKDTTIVLHTKTVTDGNTKEVKVNLTTSPSNNRLIIINGKECDRDIYTAINSEYIKQKTIYTGAKAVEQYGEKGKNGVIVVTLKSDRELYNPSEVKFDLNQKDVMYKVNGVTVEKKEAMSIDPKTIKSIDVLKGDNAVKAYGEKANNGVVMIHLKDADDYKREESRKETVTVIDLKSASNKPLYVVNGEIKTGMDIGSLSPDSIKSISVLKSEAAIKKYGEKAKEGVIEIILK